MESETMPQESAHERWTLIRDVLVFEIKLLVDGSRDLLLLPVSLVVGFISLFTGGARPGSEFYDLLRLARRSERWINLFGAVEVSRGPATEGEKETAKDLDTLVSRVESFLIDEYHKGGITAQAKERLDAALDSVHKVTKRRDRGQQE